jgi:hypothetical protein
VIILELKKFEKGREKYKEIETWRGDNYRRFRFQLENGKKYEISVLDSYGLEYSRVMHYGDGICEYCGEVSGYLYCKKMKVVDFLEEIKNHPKIRIELLFGK